MILALIATLLALVVRANATPARSASSADAAPAPVADTALAIRYANALAEPDDDDDDEAPEDDDAGIADVEGVEDDDHDDGEAVEDLGHRDLGTRDLDLALNDDLDDFADADSPLDDAGEPGGQVGALALLDAEQAPPGSVGDDDARLASSSAGGDETYEAWMRHRRPSRWGRLDVGLAVRQSTTAPLHTPAYRREELWLVATWRR